MTFPINTTIPAAGNNPSNDQPLMLQNNININSYVSVDHIIPGATLNGFHSQSSYVAQPTITTLANSVNLQSSNGIGYVHDSSATPANFTNTQFVNDHYYFNGTNATQSTYPLNIIRAYGLFNNVGTLANGFNITGGVRNSIGNFTITFSQPSAGTAYGYLVTAFRPTLNDTTVVSSLTVANAGSITVEFVGINPGGFRQLVDPNSFTVVILGV